MTLKAAKLLRLMKKAQMYQDGGIMFDFEVLNVGTIHDVGGPHKNIDLKGYKTSLFSTLDHLVELGYIDYDKHTGAAFVKHAGWYAHSMTLKAAVDFALKDILVPIAVAIATSILMGFL